jgi:uncharacterized MAPEG superfamily protein
VAGFLPYFGTLTAKIGGERFDNSNPRDWLNAQSGFRKRANAAHHNSFEAFPFFAAAVIIAHIAGAPQGRIDLFAVVFILARLFYIAFYVTNMATLRSLAWFVGLGSVVALFLAVA